MKLIIGVIILILVIVAIVALDSPDSSSLVRECPQEKIINKMPGPGVDPNGNAYYILNGVRREISEFDGEWVGANCKVEEQVVY